MFRIRHKPTGRFVQKADGSMGWTAHILNTLLCMPELDETTYKLKWVLSIKGLGHAYNTRDGAENFINHQLISMIRDQFEIVEYKEVQV